MDYNQENCCTIVGLCGHGSGSCGSQCSHEWVSEFSLALQESKNLETLAHDIEVLLCGAVGDDVVLGTNQSQQ